MQRSRNMEGPNRISRDNPRSLLSVAGRSFFILYRLPCRVRWHYWNDPVPILKPQLVQCCDFPLLLVIESDRCR